MQKVQELLTEIVKSQLFETKSFSFDEQYTDKTLVQMLTEAKQQAVFPIVFECIKDTLKKELPAQEYNDFENLYLSYIADGIKNRFFHCEIHKLLDEQNIPYVILKGCASAMYYPNPLLRPMGDVDFLIGINDIAKTDTLLSESGYVKDEKTSVHDFHWEYRKNGKSVEMHWCLPGVPTTNKDIINRYTRNIIENRLMVCNEGQCFYVPSVLHHGLILLLHTISHLTSSGIGLRHFCDWIVFENSLSNSEFITVFSKPLKEIGLWKFAQIMTMTGVLYFGCEEREWCEGIDVQICEAFLEDVFAGGNFGVKNVNRKSQTKLIRNNRSRRITKNSFFHNMLTNVNVKVKRYYPNLYNNRVLYPIGWSIIVCRYFIRALTGKTINVFTAENLSESNKRQKLYAELNLFEPEDIDSNFPKFDIN